MASAKAKTLAQRLVAVTRRGLPALATPAAKAPHGAPPARRATPPHTAFPSKEDQEEYDPEALHKALREMRAALDSDLDAEARARGDDRYFVHFSVFGDVDSPGLLLVAAGAETTTRDFADAGPAAGTAPSAGASDLMILVDPVVFVAPRGGVLTTTVDIVDKLETSEPGDAIVPSAVGASDLIPSATPPRSLVYTGGPSPTRRRGAAALMLTQPRQANGSCTRFHGSPMHTQRASYMCWTPWGTESPKERFQRASYVCWTPWETESQEEKPIEALMKLLDRVDLSEWSIDEKSAIKEKFNSLFYPQMEMSDLEEYVEHHIFTLKELMEVTALLQKKLSTFKEEIQEVDGKEVELKLLHVKVDILNKRLDSIECWVKELLEESRQQKKVPWGIVEIRGRKIDILEKVVRFTGRVLRKIIEGFHYPSN